MNTHNRFHVFHHFSLSVNHFLKNNSNSSHTQKTYEEPETTGISASCFPSVHYCRADYIICGTHWVSQNENTALPFCQWFRVSRWRQQSIKPITGPCSKLGPVSHPRGASLFPPGLWWCVTHHLSTCPTLTSPEAIHLCLCLSWPPHGLLARTTFILWPCHYLQMEKIKEDKHKAQGGQ